MPRVTPPNVIVRWARVGQMHDQGDLGCDLGRLEDDMRAVLTQADRGDDRGRLAGSPTWRAQG
jgi:hypothetical protein